MQSPINRTTHLQNHRYSYLQFFFNFLPRIHSDSQRFYRTLAFLHVRIDFFLKALDRDLS